jgi:hypothetical protein
MNILSQLTGICLKAMVDSTYGCLTLLNPSSRWTMECFAKPDLIDAVRNSEDCKDCLNSRHEFDSRPPCTPCHPCSNYGGQAVIAVNQNCETPNIDDVHRIQLEIKAELQRVIQNYKKSELGRLLTWYPAGESRPVRTILNISAEVESWFSDVLIDHATKALSNSVNLRITDSEQTVIMGLTWIAASAVLQRTLRGNGRFMSMSLYCALSARIVNLLCIFLFPQHSSTAWITLRS